MEFIAEAFLRLVVAGVKLFELHTLAQFFRGRKTTLERWAEKSTRDQLAVNVIEENDGKQLPKNK